MEENKLKLEHVPFSLHSVIEDSLVYLKFVTYTFRRSFRLKAKRKIWSLLQI